MKFILEIRKIWKPYQIYNISKKLSILSDKKTQEKIYYQKGIILFNQTTETDKKKATVAHQMNWQNDKKKITILKK